ncbi:MAG TPA: HAD family phosphatase [Pyrinomonadaceae bacterium]|nr:HAD family phosphatase [Pyrinomonadaceae bacterium]
MIQAVFFDFNGVIIDDEPLHLKAYTEALREAGVELTEEAYLDSLGMDDATFVRAAFERVGREFSDEELRRVIESEHAKHRALIEKELPIFPGVVTFVKALARSYPLGIVSMAARSQIDYALERAGLARHFAVIVSAEDVNACKPDPACYRAALYKLNAARADLHVLPFSAGECLVVEDSPPGIRSARAAGMLALGVTNTVPDAALRAAGAHSVTRSLADWTVDALQHVFDSHWAAEKR